MKILLTRIPGRAKKPVESVEAQTASNTYKISRNDLEFKENQTFCFWKQCGVTVVFFIYSKLSSISSSTDSNTYRVPTKLKKVSGKPKPLNKVWCYCCFYTLNDLIWNQWQHRQQYLQWSHTSRIMIWNFKKTENFEHNVVSVVFICFKWSGISGSIDSNTHKSPTLSQNHKRFKRTLFIEAKHNLKLFGVTPFVRLQNNT